MSNRSLCKQVQDALSSFGKDLSEAPPWRDRKVVIYGAGGFGRDLANVLSQKNVEVMGFLDRQGTGQIVMGRLRSVGLDSAEAEQWAAKSPVSMIGVFNGSAPLLEIASKLKQMGFGHIATPMELYLYLAKDLGWRYWLGTPGDYAAAANAIARVCSLWADPLSERLFLETLLFRLSPALNAISSVTNVAFQYADPSLPRWEEPLRMIDGGAYTGDTVGNLLRLGYRFASIHAFEPDLRNFEALRNSAAGWPQPCEISLWPCGMASSTSRLNFTEGNKTSSRFCHAGHALASVVALDDVLHGHRINFIKLDIEGAEADALRGARRLIEKNQPGMAICLYHYPHHLWEIPLLVSNLNPNCRLHYRVYEQNTFEAVLYAIPK